MSRLWKIVVLALLVLPMGAYAAGALTSSSPRDPEPRPPILVEDPVARVSPGSTLTPSPRPAPEDGDGDGDGDEDGDEDGDDDVTVVRPDILVDDDDDDDDGDDD